MYIFLHGVVPAVAVVLAKTPHSKYVSRGVTGMMTLSNVFFSIESSGDDVSPDTKLRDIVYLAELCIDLLHQNEEHHAEVVISTTLLVTQQSFIYILQSY